MTSESFAVERTKDGFRLVDGETTLAIRGVKRSRQDLHCWITATSGQQRVVDTLLITEDRARERFRTDARQKGVVVRELALRALAKAAGELVDGGKGNTRARDGGASAPPSVGHAAAAPPAPPVRRLADTTTVLARPVTLSPAGTTFVATWLPVAVDDAAKGKTTLRHELVVVSRDAAGTIRLHGPAADLIGVASDLPSDITIGPLTLPVTSHDNALLGAVQIREILAGKGVDIARLHADLAAAFARFCAFPSSSADDGCDGRDGCDGLKMDVTADDYAAYLACYALTTYILAAFKAVGYLWLTGLFGSGKSTVAFVLARVACLPLLASSSSTLASLRSHADAGGTLITDNFDTVNGKDDSTRAIRNFWEVGYTHGAVVTLQVPDPHGRGWVTARCNVFGNRVATAIADPMGALASRSMKVLMLRTDDAGKAERTPWDDDDWPVSPHELVQRCWVFSLLHLADAASIVKGITSAGTGLTNRDLQAWRPVLTVARLVDEASGTTAVWDGVLRLARHINAKRAEEGGTREVFVTRALLALAKEGKESATASVVMERAGQIATAEDADVRGLETAPKVGKLLTKLGVPKVDRTGTSRGYLLADGVLERLKATYLRRPGPEAVTPVAPVTPVMGLSEEIDPWILETFPEGADDA